MVSRAVSGGRAWLVAGALAGLALYVLRQRLEDVARDSMVDWFTVERLATSRLRGAPGTLSRDDIAATLPSYRTAMERIVPLLEGELGSPLPGVVERYSVVDRVAWVHANLGTFRQLIGHLEEALGDELRPRRGDVAGSLMLVANRFLSTRQIGYLLAFMAQRVLGQYDLAILSAEGEPGQLLFVEENVRATARALDVPVAEMRTWVALHETTHAYEFEAHPWLREHMNGLLQRYFAALGDDLINLRTDLTGLTNLVKRVGSNVLRGEGYAVELVMTADQRAIFRSLQALMCLLEGYSNHVMDRVGRDILPSYDRMKARFEDRLRRKGVAERLFAKLTGLDVKYEQYVLGERFVNEVVSRVGIVGMNRVWRGPEMLPTLEEIRQPAVWLARIR